MYETYVIAARASSSLAAWRVSMHASVPSAEIAHAGIASIDVGRLSLGQISIGHLTVTNAAVGITAGQALLRDVTVTVRLDFQLVWSLRVPLPWPFDDIVISERTSNLGGVELPVPFGDAEIPGLNDINLIIPSITADNVTTTADPVDTLRIDDVAAEGIQVTDITLPTAGFTLTGLGLNGIEVDRVAVPAAGVGGATVQHVRGAPISLPSLQLHNLGLPEAAVNDITSGTLNIPLRRVAPYNGPTIPLGILHVQLRVLASARTRVGQMQMTGVRTHANVGTVELRNVTVPFDVVNLTLSNLGLDTISIPLIGVN
jgi:hypothetical protein